MAGKIHNVGGAVEMDKGCIKGAWDRHKESLEGFQGLLFILTSSISQSLHSLVNTEA
jgi:hypothetical protein